MIATFIYTRAFVLRATGSPATFVAAYTNARATYVRGACLSENQRVLSFMIFKQRTNKPPSEERYYHRLCATAVLPFKHSSPLRHSVSAYPDASRRVPLHPLKLAPSNSEATPPSFSSLSPRHGRVTVLAAPCECTGWKERADVATGEQDAATDVALLQNIL
jgi:hypothetical protein